MLEQIEGAGTVTTYSYDAADRLKVQSNKNSGGSVLSEFAYNYDPVGNRINLTENGPAQSSVKTTWTYDKTYRLVNAHRTPGQDAFGGYNTTFVYDSVGNRLQQNNAGDVTDYSYDAANQIVYSNDATNRTTYVFDRAGNQQAEIALTGQRTTYTWDFENQNTFVTFPTTSRISMLYNGDLRRVRRELP